MMIQKFVFLFLVMMAALVGLVRAEDAQEVVVASAKGLNNLEEEWCE